MKKTVKTVAFVLFALLLIASFASCNREKSNDLWASATYTQNTELGNGSKTLTVEVKVLDKTVTFTIHTDKATVGEALMEHQLIAGDEGAYGLYIKKVNGITADYDIDQSYWLFYVNGEYAMSGVELTEITEGVVYQLAYTK